MQPEVKRMGDIRQYLKFGQYAQKYYTKTDWRQIRILGEGLVKIANEALRESK